MGIGGGGWMLYRFFFWGGGRHPQVLPKDFLYIGVFSQNYKSIYRASHKFYELSCIFGTPLYRARAPYMGPGPVGNRHSGASGIVRGPRDALGHRYRGSKNPTLTSPRCTTVQ